MLIVAFIMTEVLHSNFGASHLNFPDLSPVDGKVRFNGGVSLDLLVRKLSAACRWSQILLDVFLSPATCTRTDRFLHSHPCTKQTSKTNRVIIIIIIK